VQGNKGHGLPVAAGKVRRSVTLTEELVAEVEAWRAAQRPITTDSQAIEALLRQALKAWREQHEPEQDR
jgi:metal-responsive CopG/Arc/MetJ family transcriptional regulator